MSIFDELLVEDTKNTTTKSKVATPPPPQTATPTNTGSSIFDSLLDTGTPVTATPTKSVVNTAPAPVVPAPLNPTGETLSMPKGTEYRSVFDRMKDFTDKLLSFNSSKSDVASIIKNQQKAFESLVNKPSPIDTTTETGKFISPFSSVQTARDIRDATLATNPKGIMQGVTDVSKSDVPFAGALLDANDVFKVYKTNKKLQSGQKVEQEDLVYMRDFLEKQDALQKRRQSDASYAAGETFRNSLTFMAELGTAVFFSPETGGTSIAAMIEKQGAIKTAKEITKKMLADKTTREIMSKELKAYGITATNVVGSQAVIHVPEDALNRMVGTPTFSNNMGEVKVSIANDGQKIKDAVLNAFVSSVIETSSEYSGGLITGAPKFIVGLLPKSVNESLLKSAIVKAVLQKNPNLSTNILTQFFKKAGWNGIAGEMGEEQIGNIMYGIAKELGISDQGFTMPTMKDLVNQFVSFSLMGSTIKSLENGYRAVIKKELPNNLPPEIKDLHGIVDKTLTDTLPPDGTGGASGESASDMVRALEDAGADRETALGIVMSHVDNQGSEELTPEALQADIEAFMNSTIGIEEETRQESTPAPAPQQEQIVQPAKKITDTLKDTSKDIKYDMTPTVEPAEFSDTNTVFAKGDYGVNTEGKLVEVVSGNDNPTEQEKLTGNEAYLRTREVGTKEDYIDYANQLRKATPEEIDLANQYELENPPVANPRKSLSDKEKKQREADITIRISSFSPVEKAEVEKYHSLFTKMFENYDTIAEKNPQNLVGDNYDMAMEELLKSENLTEKQQKFIMDSINSMGEGYVENFEKFARYMADNELLDVILSRLPPAGKAKKATQKDKVKEVLGKKEKATIKEIADATGILEPNVRRILGVGAKEGDFERVAEGVYRITDSKGNEIAVIIPGDAITTLPQLAKDGFKADMVFLDIPYETAGQKGGKEGKDSFRRLADYNLISPKDFEIVVKAVEDIVRDDDTPVIYMYAKGKTSSKEMQEYTNILANSSFKVIAQGDYYKVNKDGEVLNLPMRTMESGEKMPPEGILVFSKSGEVQEKINDADLQFKLRRPTGYKTEKPAEMIAKMIEMTTEEGDIVLDPFAGSGVTGAESVKAGRKAVLIEKNKEVADTITKPRVEGAVPATNFKDNVWDYVDYYINTHENHSISGLENFMESNPSELSHQQIRDRYRSLQTDAKIKEVEKPKATDINVGDVFYTGGVTNMKSPVTVSSIEGRTVKFKDADGVEYAGLENKLVREFIKDGKWEKIPNTAVYQFTGETIEEIYAREGWDGLQKMHDDAYEASQKYQQGAFGYTQQDYNRAVGVMQEYADFDPNKKEEVKKVAEVKDVFLQEEYTSNEEPTRENQSVSRELFGKEVTKYIQAVNDKLGWTVESKDATKAGKISFKSVFNNDYVSTILWKTPKIGIYISVNSNGWDTVNTGTIMYRVTKPEIKYTGMSNEYSSVTTSSGDFADIIDKLVTREENKMIDNVDKSSTIKDNEQGTEPKTISDTSEISTTDDMGGSSEVTGEPTRYDRATMLAQSGNGLEPAGANGLTKKQRQLINEEVEAILEDKNYSTSPDDYSLNDLDLMAAYSGAGGKESVGGEGAGLLNEYYTPRPVVIQMWNILERLMPNVETAFEPSAGIGKIINDAPARLQVDGAEISKVSGTIAQILNPQSKITIGDFQELFFDRATNKQKPINTYDAVIGNPPFGDRAGFLKGKGEESTINRQEEYFIKRGLDMTKEGGYLVYVVNSSFLKTGDSKGKQKISELGELIEAYRLPENSFDDTSIGTDIVVFRRNPTLTGNDSIERPELLRRQRLTSGDSYFDNNPQNKLGASLLRKNRFGQTESYVKGDLESAMKYLETILPEVNPMEKALPEETQTIKLSELAGVMGIPFTRVTEDRGRPEYGKQYSLSAISEGKTWDEARVSDLDNALNKGAKVIEQEGDFTVVENPASYSSTGEVTYTRFKNEEADQTSGDKETLLVNKKTAENEDVPYLAGNKVTLDKDVTPEKRVEWGNAEIERINASLVRERGADTTAFVDWAVKNKNTEKGKKVRDLLNQRKIVEDYVKENKQKKATKEDIDHLLGKDKKKAVKKGTEKDSFSVMPKKNWEKLVAPTTNISNKKNATQVETAMLRRIDRDLAIPTPSQDEMKYLNLQDGKYYPDAIYFAGEIYQKLETLKKDKKTVIENFGQAQYDKQEKGLNSVIPAPYAIGDITFDPIDRHIAQIKAKGMKWGEEVDTTILGLFNDYVRMNDVALSPRVSKYDISNYVNGHNAAKGTKPIMGFIKNDAKRLFNHFLKHELPADLQKSITERYNKEKNGYVKPDYSQLPVEVKNMSKTFKKDENGTPLEFKMSQTQKNGVSFLVNKGSGALAWGVGVGKTLGLAIATKANMDKGWTKRPLFIVPTPTIQGTWINTFQEMFPDLKINNFEGLQADVVRKLKKERGEDKTQWIKDGEFTIISHQGILKLGFKPEEINGAVKDLNDALWKEDKGTKRKGETVKDKMEGIVGNAQKFVTDVMISDLGVDHVSVDEVHNFRKIFQGAKPENVDEEGNAVGAKRYGNVIGGTPSKRAQQLFLISQYIQKRNNNRNVFLASATPVENHATEVYNILSLMARDRMEKMGLLNINDFFSVFANFEVELDQSMTGEPINREKMKSFANVQALQALVKEFIDFQQDPTLVRPERRVITPQLQMSDLQEQNLQKIQELLTGVKTIIDDSAAFTEDSKTMYDVSSEGAEDGAFLKASTYSIANSVSPYFIKEFAGIPPSTKALVEASPKIVYTLNALKELKKDPKTKDFGSFVFFGKMGVEYHPAIAKYFEEELGYKAGEVAYISGNSVTEEEKEKIKEDFNSGKVKVLIGGDQTKEGIDLQQNGFMTFNLALGWNPTQIAQVEGRVWRQGNKRSIAPLVYPLVENSGDAMIYNKFEEKGGRINDLFSYAGNVFDVGEVDPAEKKLALITDPVFKAKMQVEIDKTAFYNERVMLDNDMKALQKLRGDLTQSRESIPEYEDKLKQDWLSEERRTEYKKLLKNAKDRVARLEQKLKDKGITNVNVAIGEIEGKMLDIDNQIKDIQKTEQPLIVKFTKEYNESIAKRKTMGQHMEEIKGLIGELVERTAAEIDAIRKQKIAELEELTRQAIPEFQRVEDRPEEVSKLQELHDKGMVLLIDQRSGAITGEQFDKEWEKLDKEYRDFTAPQFQVKQDNLTLKTLEKLSGRASVSKQYISDLTNSGDIKQAEREAIRDVLKDYKDGTEVSLPDFIDKVKATLLPLQVEWEASEYDSALYENVVLPSEIRGDVAEYFERAYGSPVETKGGKVHGFEIDNYFAHTRIEDMKYVEYLDNERNNGLRRVIEIQSDLFQKGRLADEQFGMGDYDFFDEQEVLEQFLDFVSKEKGITYAEADEMYSNEEIDMTPENEMGGKFIDFSNDKRAKELEPLLPYRNTWWERIIKEEVQDAARTKMTRLQFPTGETAMQIEGLGADSGWVVMKDLQFSDSNSLLSEESLKVGEVITRNNDYDSHWVITDVLGNGKFKAIPKEKYDKLIRKELAGKDPFSETFDVSKNVDTSNPIYKFYEKDVQRYLKNRYNAKQVTDAQGVTWIEVALTPEMAKQPIEAFQRVTPSDEPMTTFADAKKRLLEYQKRLGVKFDVDFADVILTGEMGKNMPVTAYGVTYNNKITLIQNIKQTTADHELVHIVVNNIEKIDAFKGITREALLTAQNGGKEVSEKDVNRLNEELAIGFQLHILEQDQSNVPMIIRRFYQKLQLLLTDFFKAVGKDVNVIQDFYRRLQFAQSKQKPVTFATQDYLDRKARYQWKDKQVMDFSFDTMKEMDDIRRKQFQRIEEIAKEYSTNFKRKDINYLENLVATSRDLYLKDKKEFAQADAFMKIGDTRRMKKEILDQKFSDIMSPYFDLKKGEQVRVNEILMQGDELGKDFELEELVKKGLNDSQIAGYFAIRRGFNVAHKLLIVEMENAGVKKDEIDTFEKTRKGYMPHKWAYRYAIKTQYLGEGLDPTQNSNWKTDSMDVYKTEREANKVFEQLKKDNKSPETTRYINDTLDSLDVDFFSEQRFSLENMKSVIAKAKTGQDVKDQMVNAMRDIVKEKGFGRHFIKRTGIKGYETKDVPAIIANYFTGLDGFLTKMEAGKAYYGVLEKVDARRQKRFYAWLRDSIAYDMGNTAELDWIKKTAFIYALANDMSFLLTNATQNWTVGVGELTKLYDNKLSKIAGAEAQLMKATSDWAFGNLSPEERVVVEGLIKVGRLGGEMTSELMGFKNNPMYRTMGSWVNTAFYKSTAFVEQNVNRVPAFLAARRILKAKGLSDKEVNEQALIVSDDINFRGGKQHRPVFMRGKIGVAFVFNTYIRSLLYQLSRDLKEKEFVALSKKMFYTTLLGGTSALPFSEAILSLVKAILPPDPEEETKQELYTWEMALRKGVINAWANIDISSRVNINLFGVDNIIKDPLNVLSWLGAVGGLGKRVWDGKTLYTQERYLEAFGKLFPDFLANPLKGYNGAVYGVTTLAGNPLTDENGNDFKYTTYEGWVKAFGYSPARESLAWDEMNKKWIAKDEQSAKSSVVQGKIKRQVREGDIEGAKATQQEALASGDLTKNSTDNVKSALTDKTMQESYTKWNTGVKNRPVLDAIERDIAKEIYGDNYTKLQLTNVTREFAFYRTFGFDDKVANEVKDARTTEEKVIALNKAREEMGLEPFKVFFNKGRTVVRYENTSTGGENTGYVLISDAVRKAYFSQTKE